MVLFSMNTEASADLHRSGSRSSIGWQIREGAGPACVGWAAARSSLWSPALAEAPPPVGARSRLRQLQVAGAQADAIQRLWGRQRQRQLVPPAASVQGVSGQRDSFRPPPGQLTNSRALLVGEEGARSWAPLPETLSLLGCWWGCPGAREVNS